MSTPLTFVKCKKLSEKLVDQLSSLLSRRVIDAARLSRTKTAMKGFSQCRIVVVVYNL